MTIFNAFQKRMLYNYILGSLIAVLGVGSVFIFQTLELQEGQSLYMGLTILLSLGFMLFFELLVYRMHIKPIRAIYRSQKFAESDIEKAFYQSLHFPLLTVQRIMLPHFLGLSIPASVLTLYFISNGQLSFPYAYIGYAWAGAFLVAVLHALIEFYLTFQTAAPLLNDLADKAEKLYARNLLEEKHFYISLKKKLLIGSIFLAAFPILLFTLASHVRLSLTTDPLTGYWNWAGLLLGIILALAFLGTVLLFRNIEQPVKDLQNGFKDIESGKVMHMKNTYSDEFSDLVSGFNNMVTSLQEKDKKNQRLIASFFDLIAGTLDARDPYTAGHSTRVAGYSVQIAERAGWPQEKVELLKKSALLHDIGKIGIRDDVLLKDGRLSEEEFAQIKLHPEIGTAILEGIDLTEELLPILPGVKYHHERYDGKGYPEGLNGRNIPEFGRLIAVADAYDAMTSDRPYRNGMSDLKALSILEEGRNTQWDPDYVNLFIELKEESMGMNMEKASAIR